MVANSGSCTDAIIESLKDYTIICALDKKEILSQRTVIDTPQYYCCSLEYAEDAMMGKLPLENLTIEDAIIIDEMSFELIAIIYFQGLHYTIHFRGAFHPTLFPNTSSEWFYHDGMRDGYLNGKFVKGFIFHNTPTLNYDLMNSHLKPYILIYKVTPLKIE